MRPILHSIPLQMAACLAAALLALGCGSDSPGSADTSQWDGGVDSIDSDGGGDSHADSGLEPDSDADGHAVDSDTADSQIGDADGAEPDGDGDGDTSQADTDSDTDSHVGSDADAHDTEVTDGQVDADPDSAGGFNDHAVPKLAAEADFFALAADGNDPAQVKFILSDYFEESDPEPPNTYFLESDFYTLHDEWYWFTLLNGEPIPNWDVQPVTGYDFATIDEVYQTMSELSELPLGLKFAGQRLYSPKFYASSLSMDRFFGLGSVLHYPANPDRVVPEEIWAFELEYTDPANEEMIVHFFERLASVLPPAAASSMRWLARSPAQEELASTIQQGGGAYADRTLTYADLVVAGAVQVYNPGVAAGRILRIPKGQLDQSILKSFHLAVLEEIPDYLPPVAAIVTGVPQTPLAHIAILAKARGTLNAHVAGAFANQQWYDWSYFNKPVAMWGRADDTLLAKAISTDEYTTYLGLKDTPPVELVPAELEGMPLWTHLDEFGLDAAFGLVPMIGGKAAHLAAFGDYAAMDSPDLPMALTVRGYAEHMASLVPGLQAAFSTSDFLTSSQVRFIALEGPEAYVAQAADPQLAQQFVEQLVETHPPGTNLGALIAAGGARAAVEAKPMDSGYRTFLEAKLKARYATFDESQGLRFRSSSTAEDIDGFNGAGLYESNTGFLYPEEQSGKDKKKTIEHAVKRTWSSSFTFEAFEERRISGVDHLDARMGVLVHARFDDNKEKSNGVCTLELVDTAPLGSPPVWHAELVVNVQLGALSVTNPPEGSNALPEVDLVLLAPGAEPVVTRAQSSTETAPGVWLLTDAHLVDMASQARQLAIDWLARANQDRADAKQHRTVTLDFEFRETYPGWPALQVGGPTPLRFIWKQVRTLPRAITLPEPYWSLPVPTDLLAHVEQGWRSLCTSSKMWAQAVDLYTSADETWPFNYATQPYLGALQFYFGEAPPGFDGIKGQVHTIDMLDIESIAASGADADVAEASVTVVLGSAARAATGIGSVQFHAAQDLQFVDTSGQVWSPGATCSRSTFALTPAQYLKSLFADELEGAAE